MVAVIRRSTMRITVLPAAFALMTSLFQGAPLAASYGGDTKMTVDEVVARHLEAIGSTEARAAVRTRAVSGAVRYVSRTQAGTYDGKAVLVSIAAKVRLSFQFPDSVYLAEQLAYDGEHPGSGKLPNGNRSTLGRSLIEENVPLREGLLGGVLSAAWPLLRLAQQNPKLDYRGLKKIEGRQLHELSYRPRKGSSNMTTLLYLEPDTFRHVRSVYKFDLPERFVTGTLTARSAAQPADVAQEGGVSEAHFTVIEEFGDFRQTDGLTLPHSYKLRLNISGTGRSLAVDWSLVVEEISHKETLDENLFKLPR